MDHASYASLNELMTVGYRLFQQVSIISFGYFSTIQYNIILLRKLSEHNLNKVESYRRQSIAKKYQSFLNYALANFQNSM